MTTIDGREAPSATTVLEAIRGLGIEIPSLCKDDNLPALGACRTCLVEADGRIVASCTTALNSVREVSTGSDTAVAVRKGVLALTRAMVADPDAEGGPHGAELSAVAPDETEYGTSPGRATVDDSNPFFIFRESECILCGRCASACQDLQHIGAIAIAGRGREARVTPGADGTFQESICTSCGSCIAACPTPALSLKGSTAR